jgi:hypothetical protein
MKRGAASIFQSIGTLMNLHFGWSGREYASKTGTGRLRHRLLESGLHLTFFSEPEPVSGEPSRQEDYRRVPWFVVMEWRRPANP